MPHQPSRRPALWFGATIALAIAFVIGLMVYSMRQDETMNAPAEGTEQSTPSGPDKPPPLNQ